MYKYIVTSSSTLVGFSLESHPKRTLERNISLHGSVFVFTVEVFNKIVKFKILCSHSPMCRSTLLTIPPASG